VLATPVVGHDGEVVGQCTARHRHQEFLRIPRKLDRECPKSLDLHQLLDNSSRYSEVSVRAWYDAHPRLKLHFVPTSSSWLNLVESVFADLTKRRLRRGIFPCVDHLVEASVEYLDHAAEPYPQWLTVESAGPLGAKQDQTAGAQAVTVGLPFVTPAHITPEEANAMGTIRVHEFTTLDGVIDAPTWAADYPFDPRMGEAIASVMGGCKAILLGRHTFEMFAPAWSQRTAAEDPGAPFMNDSPKYVIAATPLSVEWSNATLLGGYDAARLRRLKEDVGGGIYVSGSGTLVRAMLRDRLVDELHLFMYPIVSGSGARLFGDETSAAKLELEACESYSGGVVRLTYRVPYS